MSKALRLHAPGCVFHITARTQGKHPWFTDELKVRVENEIIASARMSGMIVLAYVVMPNHFHVVIRQSTQPLAFMMHRLMHRSALMVKRAHGIDGHVFGRRYWSGLCATPAYVRRAIIYTHLNPSRACLCANPESYQWSSHAAYMTPDSEQLGRGRTEGLKFFSVVDGEDPIQHYLEHVRFQMSIDAYIRGELFAGALVPPPACAHGDLHWDENYQSALQIAEAVTPRQPIFDVACRLLERLDARSSLDHLRTGLRTPKLVVLRRNLVAALLTAGYRGTQIARLLGISTSAISKVAVSLRA